MKMPDNNLSWLIDALHWGEQDVGTFIPDGFDRYARIFHPAYRNKSKGEREIVRWQDVVRANNRSIAEEMQWLGPDSSPSRYASSEMQIGALAGQDLWDDAPASGQMPTEVLLRFLQILRKYTATPDAVYLCISASLSLRPDNS